MKDLISGETIRPASFSLKPFQYVWLTPTTS
jgi:hypothetical protein